MTARVVVKVELVHVEPTATDSSRVRWQAQCRTGECAWTSPLHYVRAGAEEEARWHRPTHRKDS